MTIAVLNDVHGNLSALEAVLAEPDVAEADTLVFGGDLVPGPHAAEVVQLVRELGRRAVLLRGNGEREVCAAALTTEPETDTADQWVKRRLDIRDVVKLRDLPIVRELESAIYCHATPTDDAAFFTTLTSDSAVLDAVAPVRKGLLAVGHTHVQFDRTIGELRIVNPGSVGLPYEGSPGARWAIIDGPQVYLRCTPYDTAATADAWHASGYPDAEQWCSWLREPPGAVEVLAHFESLRAAAPGATDI